MGYYEKEIDFLHFNANPKGNETNDCVIRAISLYITKETYPDWYGFLNGFLNGLR